MKLRIGLTVLVACAGSAVFPVAWAQPAAPTPDSLVVAAKRLSGTDFAGTFARICVAPDNMPRVSAGRGPAAGAGRAARAATAAPRPAPVPDRATWYAPPFKVFDNLYWVGTKIHNSWVLKTSAGLIVIDTLYDYAVEPEIIEGMKTLKLDPKQIKYVIISHDHADHAQGAALLQSRFGAHVVMGAPDWETTLARSATSPGGVPVRGPGDIAVGPEGAKITLGDTTMNVIFTPGQTVGTLSYIFPVKDHDRALVLAYSGGTAFNFPRTAENFQTYEDSQKKMVAAAAAAGATVLVANNSEYDDAWNKVRAAQVPRAAGEPHPFEVGADGVRRYFEMTADCAESQRLSMQ